MTADDTPSDPGTPEEIGARLAAATRRLDAVVDSLTSNLVGLESSLATLAALADRWDLAAERLEPHSPPLAAQARSFAETLRDALGRLDRYGGTVADAVAAGARTVAALEAR